MTARLPVDAGLRRLWPWDLLITAAGVVTAVLVGTTDHPAGSRAGAMVLVTVGWVGWLLIGRRLALRDDPRPGPAQIGYCVALAVALAVAIVLVPAANWAAFAVLPQLFWLLPLPWAVGTAVLVSVALPITSGLLRGELGDALGFLPQTLFMTTFGVLVGVWIRWVTSESSERARLLGELERSREREAELSREAGAVAERERLAGEIHDTLAQGFTSILTLLQAARAEFGTDPQAALRHVDLAVTAARENLQEARTLVAAGAPGTPAGTPVAETAPDGISLAAAIGRAAGRLAEQTGADVEHGVSGSPRVLPPDHEIVLLRAAQELLANVARHAAATTVTVRLDYREPDTVALAVADDGTGFDPAHAGGDGHFGLALLRERVARLGGRVSIDSTAPTAAGAGSGTLVTVEVPG